ncbi:MAG TPA: hypothetical protein VIP11_19520, partial [Gemmatimonadaceae bacterium]
RPPRCASAGVPMDMSVALSATRPMERRMLRLWIVGNQENRTRGRPRRSDKETCVRTSQDGRAA